MEEKKPTKKGDLNIAKLKESQRTLVKGQFSNLENKGAKFSFVYGSKFKGVPLEKFTLADQEVRYLPLEVAQHLNSLKYPVYSEVKDHNGNPAYKVTRMEKRVSFDHLGFMPIEELNNEENLLVNAEPIIK